MGLEALNLSDNNLKKSAIVVLEALTQSSQLKSLDLSGNDMTGEIAESLASVIKNNSSLEELNLSDNDLKSSAVIILQALTKISHLNVLDLSRNNMTGEVAEDLANVIKNNAGLRHLGLAGNNLKSKVLIVLQALTENSQLVILSLSINNMKGEVAEDLANVIKNNAGLRHLSLAGNYLKSKALIILQALTENSQLVVLDLSGNNMNGEVVEHLANVIKNNSGLQHLGLADNNINSKAVAVLQALKNNSQLVTLDLRRSGITGEVAEDLAQVIQNNSDLKELVLSSNDLKSSGAIVLQALARSSQLTSLDLSGNNMTEVVAEDLANVIKNNAGLRHLSLAGNYLKSKALIILQALTENSQLVVLDLSGNNMNGEVVEHLANVIKNNSGLQHLGLADNNINSKAVAVLQALKNNSQLVTLDLRRSGIIGEVAEDLARVIQNNSDLKELFLSSNDLKSSGAIVLQALARSSELTSLDLSGNNMTEVVAEDLANVIKNNLGLQQLNLSDNNLSLSVVVILRALREHKQLKILNLNRNNMTEAVADDLADDLASVIKNNSGLEELYLSGNDLKLSGAVVLQALEKNSQLISLDLSRNNMTEAVAECLANAIKNNSGLEQLGLSHNNFNASVNVILQALKDNSQLKLLDLSKNNITGQASEHLASVIKNNSDIQQLGLSDNDLRSSAVVILQALAKISQLKVLDLNRNNMTGQAAEDLANVIKNNLGLERIYLSDNNFKSSAAVILQALKDNVQLKILSLNNNKMTGEVAEDLANVIKNNSGLEELYLSDNDLRPSAVVILQALAKISQLKVLSLNRNNMTGQAAEDLANVIKNNLGLERIYLSDNDFKSSAAVILQALKDNAQLKILSLNNNKMTGEVAEDLANVIKNNSGLEELYLSDNDLRSSAVVILQALAKISQLEVLGLNRNNITGQAAEGLANVVKNNLGLERIYLSDNDFKSSAAVILQALKDNAQLKILSLNNNKMTGEVAEDLANVIKNNSGLEELYLSDNDLRSSAVVILQALAKISQLKVLSLNRNNMTGQAAEDLANVIKNNLGLERIYLSDNDFKSSTAVILQALKDNAQLEILSLNNNKMTGEVAEDLANVIKNNSGLEELYLSDNDLNSSVTVILQALKRNYQLKILELNNNKPEVVEGKTSLTKNPSGHEQPYECDDEVKSSVVVVLEAFIKDNSQFKAVSLSSDIMIGQIIENFANIIMNNSSLEKIYFSDNDLKSSTVVTLQVLMHNSQLKFLALNNVKMTEQVVKDLANVIKNTSDIQWLNLGNNALGFFSVVILQALRDYCQLKTLTLNDNQITELAAEELANIINANTDLEELLLFNNDLKSSAVVILQALQNNSQLKTLSLSNNNMTGQVSKDLASVINNNPGLKVLDLSDNDLKSSAVVILQALKDNSQLQVLGLNSINMTVQEAENLASVIKNNSGLEALYLSNNNLKASSAVVILEALKDNSQLKFLHLYNNKTTGQIAEHLTKVIRNNLSFKELDLSNNDLKLQVVLILQSLNDISQLEILSLDNNFLTDVMSHELISVIKSNSLITELWLSNNMLQSGLIDIVISCSNLINLRALGLSHNNISPTIIPSLAAAISRVNSLQVLLLSGLVLNVRETFLFQVHNASKQKLLLQSNNYCSDNELLEIGCLEIWRLQFSDRAKHFFINRNVFWTSSSVMQMIVIDTKQNFSTLLSIAHQLEQKLSELDAISMISSLSIVIIKLTVLDLEYSNIKKEAAIILAEAMNCNNVLEQLWLRGNILGVDGAAVILTSLQNISTLKILDLSYNNISSASAYGIAAVINSNHSLEQLWLDGNMLMTTGVVIIASVLKKHSTLRMLSLANNRITEDAVEEIYAIIKSNIVIGGLLVSNNQIQSLGSYKIAAEGMKFLYVLELTNNCINVTAADNLSITLSHCACLKELYLGDNKLETTGAIKICQAIKNTSTLRVLSLNNNNIDTQAASEICIFITMSTNLEILLLGSNDLQTTGVLQIADTVKNINPTMQLLSLSNNNVDEQVREDVKVMLLQYEVELFI